MMYFLYKVSKKIHLYSGLFLSLFILWMAVSGILLNHPGLISRISLSLNFLPDSYAFKNWNRYAFRDAAFLDNTPDRVFVCGKQGIWQSRNNGRTFVVMNKGFPEPAWQKDTFCLLPVKACNLLYAGTRSGLYVCDLLTNQWTRVKGVGRKKIISLFQYEHTIYAFTPSTCFTRYIKQSTGFRQTVLPPPETLPGTRSVTGFLLSLHDGSILRLPGKLGVDFLAIVLIFLTISGIYLWIVSGNLKKFKGRKRIFKLNRFCHKYHLKLGIWCALFLVVITASGTLIKPPFRQWVYKNWGSKVPITPGHLENPWEDQIFKAAFLAKQNSILLYTRQGFYMAPISLDTPFKRQDIPVRVSGMGTSILKMLSENRLLVGSFAGLFLVDLETKTLQEIFKDSGSGRQKRPLMICGALVKDGRLLGYVEYKKGFIPAGTKASTPFAMPGIVGEKATISLWYGLFELHNTRLFTFLTGSNTWLIIPAGGILTLILILSGCFDWYYKKIHIKRSRR